MNGIIDVLSAKITEWLQHKSHSMLNLTKLSDVSYPTIRRIVNKEYKSTGSDTAKSLLEAIGLEREEIRKILNEYFNGIGEFLNEDVSPALDQRYKKDLDNVLANLFEYRIFAMCDTIRGKSEEEIEARFGGEGKKVLQKLVEKELLLKDSAGIFKAKTDRWHVDSWETAQKILLNCLGMMSEDLFSNGVASVFHHTESVNSEGLKELKKNELVKNEADRKVISNPKFHGDIPIFTISAIGSFDNQSVYRGDGK